MKAPRNSWATLSWTREGWTREESLWRSLYNGHQEPFSFDLVWHNIFMISYSHVLIIFRPQSKTFRRALAFISPFTSLRLHMPSVSYKMKLTSSGSVPIFSRSCGWSKVLEFFWQLRWQWFHSCGKLIWLCISIPHFLGVSYHMGTHTTGPKVWSRHS